MSDQGEKFVRAPAAEMILCVYSECVRTRITSGKERILLKEIDTRLVFHHSTFWGLVQESRLACSEFFDESARKTSRKMSPTINIDEQRIACARKTAAWFAARRTRQARLGRVASHLLYDFPPTSEKGV